MGVYINPGTAGFAEVVRSEYIDKTSMIALINRTIGSKNKLTCISRPRRFGKSYAAQMLCAYYDRSTDSHALFDNLGISQDPSYEEHLNKYNVINVDVSGFISDFKKSGASLSGVPDAITNAIMADAIGLYPECSTLTTLSDVLLKIKEVTGAQFIFIIDEWDAVIREAEDDAQERFLNLLRGWFKNNNFTPYVVAAAYMTGILPIKKDGTQSAVSDFKEYSMLAPGEFASYTGFTETEVKELCQKHELDFGAAKLWYDGYSVGEAHSVYNPFSVMSSIENKKFKSYWKKTSAAESLMTYIDMNEEGLQEDIARLLAGERLPVNTDNFQNDFESFATKDDVLTLLIHLGYLAYQEKTDNDEAYLDVEHTGCAYIPNEEVRLEFKQIIRRSKHDKLVELIKCSDGLLQDTIEGNENKVAEAFEKVRILNYAPQFYNNEQALRYVIKFAYISCVDQYLRVEEVPSGKGIADVVFIPKKLSDLPPLVIELKWNKTSDEAITQIDDKKYAEILTDYSGKVVLVGINYDEKSKKHTCKIKKIER